MELYRKSVLVPMYKCVCVCVCVCVCATGNAAFGAQVTMCNELFKKTFSLLPRLTQSHSHILKIGCWMSLRDKLILKNLESTDTGRF
jgi:hypothetical protein